MGLGVAPEIRPWLLRVEETTLVVLDAYCVLMEKKLKSIRIRHFKWVRFSFKHGVDFTSIFLVNEEKYTALFSCTRIISANRPTNACSTWYDDILRE